MSLAEPDAFAELYTAHASYIRSIASRLLRDPAEAEDLVHDVFLQAWRDADRFDRTRGDVRGWLTVIAKSRGLDRLRRRVCALRAEPRVCAAEVRPDPCDAVERVCIRQGSARLRTALATLPTETRRILELAYLEHFSQREIAAHLGQSLGVIKSRIRQGLLALRARVERAGGSFDDTADEQRAALTTREPAEQPSRRSFRLPSLKHVRVMAIDDDADTREVLDAVLVRAGALTMTEGSAAGACQAVKDWWPDVFLVDIEMPGQDGYALIRRLQMIASRTSRDLRAIAFTARGAEQDRTRALTAGFNRHMSKPVHPIAILTAIRELVDRSTHA